MLVCVPGMLRRWDDSQKYLSDKPHLVCEETANCLVVICIDFEIDEVSQSINFLNVIPIHNKCFWNDSLHKN